MMINQISLENSENLPVAGHFRVARPRFSPVRSMFFERQSRKWERMMAKGQKRSNREVRKPKTKATPAPASTGKIGEVLQVRSGSAKAKSGKRQ